MTRPYTHDLNREVHSISGWYKIFKEERVTLNGKEYLYLVGDGVVESSCCAFSFPLREKDRCGSCLNHLSPLIHKLLFKG